MEEEEENKHYQSAFNDGYLLAKHQPELAQLISNTQNNNEYFKALIAGRNEFLTEKVKDKTHSKEAHGLDLTKENHEHER